MTCSKCEKQPQHAIQIREGDQSRLDQKSDTSTIRSVRLCKDHWLKLREFLGL